MRVRPLVSLLFFSSFAYADLGKVTLGISDLPSEIQELKGKTPQSVGEHLFEIRRQVEAGQYDDCFQKVDELREKQVWLEPWLSLRQLECTLSWKASDRRQVARLERVTDRFFQGSIKLNSPLMSSSSREQVFAAKLKQMDLYRRVNRLKAWSDFEQLSEWAHQMPQAQRYQLYRQAGELAFIEQNAKKTVQFYLKALSIDKQQDLMKRLKSLDEDSYNQLESTQAKAKTGEPSKPSSAEVALYQKFQKARSRKRFTELAQIGADYLMAYPQSQYSEAVSRGLLVAVLAVGDKDSPAYREIRKQMLKSLSALDGERLLWMGENAYVKGSYGLAESLSAKAAEKFEGQSDAAKALWIAGRSAYYRSEKAEARRYWEKITVSYPKSNYELEANFAIGISYLREKDKGLAAKFLEKVIARGESELALSAHFWLWRLFKETEEARAQREYTAMQTSYPLTYYAMKARALEEGQLKLWMPEVSKVKNTQRYFTETQSLLYRQLQAFIEGGWSDSVAVIRGSLYSPRLPYDNMFHAAIASKAKDFFTAISLSKTAFDRDPSLISQDHLGLVFPRIYEDTIKAQADKRGISPYLVQALIRQESSFRTDVTSPSNARGLMQMIPLTANEIAKDLRYRSFRSQEQLFDPELNIAFGTYYIRKLVRAFRGHIPAALAAYNAGIGRMRRWFRSREFTESYNSQIPDGPFAELWIDELPWDETRFYVKAVLRNYLLYQLLAEQQVDAVLPLWVTKSDE